jgi:hypothetical protein
MQATSAPKLWLGFAWLAIAGSIYACQVPVFRYALERWTPDRYEVLVVSKQGLSGQEQELLKKMQQQSDDPSAASYSVRSIDLSQSPDPGLQQLWREHSADESAVMAVLYPGNSQVPNRLAYASPFSEAELDRVLDSPVRRALVEKLQSGDSAVWIFVPCGNKEKDDAAYEQLSSQIKKDSEWIQLPTPEELDVAHEVIKGTKIELRIGFSIVTLGKQDPAERFVLNALLNSESDLRDFEEPLAFPVFGRGRVLYALVGKGISPETIRSATSFITGPCSCQVKNQNPGFDLLISNDWSQAVGDVLISEPIPEVSTQPRLLTIPPGREK